MRIIVVEDEMRIRDGLTNLINRNTGHSVVAQCKNGLEGLEMTEQCRPDLIITDIRMSKMDGLEMLKTLKERKELPQAVILSGYSDFEYAREALRIGVEDYLLKPISVEDVEQVLKRVEMRIETDKEENNKKPEEYIYTYLFGKEEEREEAGCLLNDRVKFETKGSFLLLCGCIGGLKREERMELSHVLKKLLAKYAQITCFEIYQGTKQQMILTLYGESDELLQFEAEFFQKSELKFSSKERKVPWAAKAFLQWGELPEVHQKVQHFLKYALTFGCDKILSEEYIHSFEQQEFQYPLVVQKNLIASLCSGNYAELQQYSDCFINYLKEHRFRPEDIKHSFLKIVTVLIETVREVDDSLYESIRTRNYLQQMSEADTFAGLEALFLELIGALLSSKEKKENISNYTIKKTINYIRIHYKEGITLEETALELGITPEYLSTLFNREMGINFSTFLKEFRISHAKRLLKGSDMKIYEIAEACGYSNAKYFTRVFKEVTGLSPAEFR